MYYNYSSSYYAGERWIGKHQYLNADFYRLSTNKTCIAPYARITKTPAISYAKETDTKNNGKSA